MSGVTKISDSKVYIGKDNYLTVFSPLKTETTLILTTQSISKSRKFDDIVNNMNKNKVHIINNVAPNPTSEDIDSVYRSIESMCPQNIVGIGGGSVIDFSKAMSARFSNPNIDTLTRLYTTGVYKPKTNRLFAIPTTAGTGSEVTPFATLWRSGKLGKFSIESKELIPDVVFLDSEWLLTAKPEQILYSGLDALSHCVETLWNRFKTPSSETNAAAGLRNILQVFPRLLSENATESDYRTMQYAAMQGGKAIAINHTALAHAMSYPLTSIFGIPHGLACSFAIPAIFRQFQKELKMQSDHFQILQEAVSFVDSLELHKKVNHFAHATEITKVIDLSSYQNRAVNFICELHDETVMHLLSGSLK
jgi:alcohol dehydrogenase class IV